MKKNLLLLTVVSVFAFLTTQSPSTLLAEQGPLAMVQAGTGEVVSLLKGSTPGESIKSGRLKEDVASLLSGYVDFEEMSSRALGHYWKYQPPEKRLHFVSLFRALFCNVYLSNLEGSDLAGLEILFDEEKVEAKYALVTTRIKSSKHPPVSVRYRMIFKDQAWKIYDVVVEGISFVNNYRSQFSSLLDREPFDSVLRRLEQRLSA